MNVDRIVEVVKLLNDEHLDRIESMASPLPSTSYETPWTATISAYDATIDFFGSTMWDSENGGDLDDEAVEEIRREADAFARYAALWVRKEENSAETEAGSSNAAKPGLDLTSLSPSRWMEEEL